MEQCALMSEREIDERIIEDCRRGDREAFRLLFEAYRDRVYSIALYWSDNEASASDITQQVFLRLFTRLGQFRRDAEFTTWLYRIVVNACLDERRSRRRLIPVGESREVKRMATHGSPEQACVEREIADSVRAAISELKPKFRLPILLKYVEGLSYEEIAGALGCSKGTVASRLNRGHKILARRLAHLRGALALSGE